MLDIGNQIYSGCDLKVTYVSVANIENERPLKIRKRCDIDDNLFDCTGISVHAFYLVGFVLWNLLLCDNYLSFLKITHRSTLKGGQKKQVSHSGTRTTTFAYGVPRSSFKFAQRLDWPTHPISVLLACLECIWCVVLMRSIVSLVYTRLWNLRYGIHVASCRRHGFLSCFSGTDFLGNSSC